MPRFYCSSCGIQLDHKRKAVPGKGMILDLISPHECEGYSIKSNEFGNPTAEDLISQAKPLGKAKVVSSGQDKSQSTFEMGDKRGDVRSMAPRSLLDAMERNKIDPSGESEG